MKVRPISQFKFQGIIGYLYSDGFVAWGGAMFQIEAARPALRTAIEAARGAP